MHLIKLRTLTDHRAMVVPIRFMVRVMGRAGKGRGRVGAGVRC